ncbi:Inner membrane protein YbhL [Aquicella siphonis]|uniref:Inner membrane protein YbhL n=1 Tax=Aquicella siphonis TaxID=254247 RepID=A0A5E4PIV3_9COXI|nr:Bax inhibitor-1/YccA family protein [Aquicella siphonis]VVC76281.1 Inner membrane protein YbhL [Aquicella siphonis]
MNSFDSRGQSEIYRQQDRAAANAGFMSRVYFWMMLGLMLSGIVAYEVAGSKEFLTVLLGSRALWFGLILVQFGAVIAISAFVSRMSAVMTTAVYLGYAILSGVTFSVILLAFTAESISQAFFITSFAFIGLSLFGYLTKRDLGPVGSFCMTGLFGVIGLILAGLIFPSIMTDAVQMTINVCGIIIFSGLTAYDTQKIKNFNSAVQGSEMARKQVIVGALTLYLDFINLFLSILRLTGGRR